MRPEWAGPSKNGHEMAKRAEKGDERRKWPEVQFKMNCNPSSRKQQGTGEEASEEAALRPKRQRERLRHPTPKNGGTKLIRTPEPS
jgi:hypothetical protein